MRETTPVPEPMDPLPPTSSSSDGELSDAELEFVVGGLTRPWVEPALPWDAAPGSR